ncbi:MAG: glycosyltransferase [Desulfobulbaceae bacterium]|nr:MAG: glycosyltransferase [Desulfobulbaceae bacterium]
MISIVTATYNAASTVADCLESVEGQIHGAIEQILVDGESTDNTVEIARKFPHLTSIVCAPDKGVFDAMNKGIELAKGEIVGILNADDMYAAPYVLRWVDDAFSDSSIDACYGDLDYVDKDDTGKVVRRWRAGSFSRRKFYWGWMPPHPTFFVRRAVYERFGLFNLELGSAADYELMLRFLVKHRLRAACIPELLVRMRTGGISNASLRNRLLANRMDRLAWDVNQLKPYPWTLYLKPLRKIGQWLVK